MDELILTEARLKVAKLCGVQTAAKEFGKFQAYYLGKTLNDPDVAWHSWCCRAVERQGASTETTDADARHSAYVKELSRKASQRMKGAYDKWKYDPATPHNQWLLAATVPGSKSTYCGCGPRVKWAECRECLDAVAVMEGRIPRPEWTCCEECETWWATNREERCSGCGSTRVANAS